MQMANTSEYMKTCSTSYIFREMKIKTIRYDIPIRMPKSKALTAPNAGEDIGQQELSFITDGNVKWYRHFGRQFGGFLEN